MTQTEFKFGSYNVKTLLDNRILELVTGCDDHDIDIITIQEHRWTTEEEYTTSHSRQQLGVFIFQLKKWPRWNRYNNERTTFLLHK